ncbi:hypothetical protein ETD86_10800 [Nonomuraea turkmeniaca]|uniref:Uncharacterized protein n=1 Tax=Nonomuraea turkmeniaca TaxID=103838 RepID=A0A5S4FPD0_9ACTN|nr:hypothetical protein [Nonomuraea turkmeniaca]TMR22617.1 hypothetical protein ETD86_10800 [Nonomuraea turkmeniaca]
MGEFVGIDPGGAERLMHQMSISKNVLAQTRPGLEAAIAEAGASWTGPQGVAAMHRSWAFFDDTQRDLKWRMDTLKQTVPSSGNGQVGVFFTFNNEAEATRQGKADAVPIAEALKQHEIENSMKSWRKVTAATAATKEKLKDPAYAASLLAALGPDRFRALFMHWMKDKGPAAMDKGLPPSVVQQGRESLGPLAEAYANAERAGRLGEEWRQFIETTDPGLLTGLVTMSKPSSTLLNQVARRVLGRSLAADRPTSPNWNLNALVEAYDANPQALQKLLAEDKDAAGWLLHPGRFMRTGVPGFEERLAGVLDKALRPGAGNDRERERAWLNIISAVGARDTPWLGGQWIPNAWLRRGESSPVSQALAKNVAPYLDKLARLQAKESSPDLTKLHPAPPWDRLDPDTAARFLGALMQDKAAANTLLKSWREYTVSMDIGRFHPFDSDPKTRAGFVNISALSSGAANLLLDGSAYAEWSDDEYADWVAGVMLTPIDWLSNKYWPIDNPATATVRDRGQDDLKDRIKNKITDYFDGKSDDTAENVANDIIEWQKQWVIKSLAQHRQMELTEEDVDMIDKAFKGRLYQALVKALERRGG